MTAQPEPSSAVTEEPKWRGTRIRDRDGDTWRRGTTRWNCEARVDGDRVRRVGRLPWHALVSMYGPLTQEGAVWANPQVGP
jgi:hypothetical protein